MHSPFLAPAWLRPAILVALLAAAPCTFAAAAPLTLAEAQRLAVLRSRQLIGIDASAAASRDMAVAAGQRPDPVLKLGLDNLPVEGADRFSVTRESMTMRRVGLSQELTSSDKRHWRAQAYSRMADKAGAEKAATTAAIERDTAIAWVERFYLEEMATLAATQEAQGRTEIDVVETAYRAGRASLAEVLAARTALAMAADRSSEAVLRARSASSELARWVGADADRPLAGAPGIDSLGLDPAQFASRIARHPQLVVLGRDEDIAQAAAKLAQADRKSDWSVELAFQQRGAAYSNMVSLELSVPLQWNRKQRQDRELAARLATVGQARAEREEAERARLAEIRAMLLEWESGRVRLARYERELLPLAADRRVALLSAYRGGKASLSDVLQGRRDETDVRLQALQIRMATARAWARLAFIFPFSSQDSQ